jgi:hypothetical protein
MKKKDSPDPLPRPSPDRPRRKLSPILYSAWPLGAVGLAAGASVVAVVALTDHGHGASGFVDRLLHGINPLREPQPMAGAMVPVQPSAVPSVPTGTVTAEASATEPCPDRPIVGGAPPAVKHTADPIAPLPPSARPLTKGRMAR